MQHLKNFNWKKFLLQGVLPCLLAVAVGFISRYQLELSDGVTESFLPDADFVCAARQVEPRNGHFGRGVHPHCAHQLLHP